MSGAGNWASDILFYNYILYCVMCVTQYYISVPLIRVRPPDNAGAGSEEAN
jgi:hypothetical protein